MMHRWLVWNVIFRAHEWAKRHPTYEILAELEAADRLPSGGLEQVRNDKLRRFIESCYANVPFITGRMQQQGIKPSDIRDAGDLQLLPIMRKADIRKHREELRSRNARDLKP